MDLPTATYKLATLRGYLATSDAERILNVGGTGLVGAVNFDLSDDADVQGDAHDLSCFSDASFDLVICTAMLQYCREPARVVAEIHRVLEPGGRVYVDVPWVQPSCDNGSVRDLWRFSEHGLRHLFRDFVVEEVGVSIPATSALALQFTALEPTRLRYVNIAWWLFWSVALRPLTWTRLGRSPGTAGAFYLVGRKH